MTALDIAAGEELTDATESTRGTLLRLATAGSVDDGKSTLVGRLLHDSKNVLADTWDSLERVSRDRGLDAADLALLTDGLRAEREQGITIDVAYRYFATGQRTFILADCPGHVQYTRNTVTGASTADVIVLLVDIRKGVLEQTRRHLSVAALLRVPHVVVAVNKIDLSTDAEADYARVADEIVRIAGELGIRSVRTVPTSALRGDNVVSTVPEGWYQGPSLLELLEELPAENEAIGHAFRLPVQYVIRPQGAALDPALNEYRGYAGQVATGRVKVGDPVVVQPAGRTTTVSGIDTPVGPADEAIAGESITLRLADEIDITRGDLIAAAADAPAPIQDVDAMLCWLHDRPLAPGARVLLKHTSRTVTAIVRDLHGRLDLASMTPEAVESLQLNDIGRVTLRTASPILAEDYATSRTTGSFILIDQQSGQTLAAGMIRGEQAFSDSAAVPRAVLDWEI